MIWMKEIHILLKHTIVQFNAQTVLLLASKE